MVAAIPKWPEDTRLPRAGGKDEAVREAEVISTASRVWAASTLSRLGHTGRWCTASWVLEPKGSRLVWLACFSLWNSPLIYLWNRDKNISLARPLKLFKAFSMAATQGQQTTSSMVKFFWPPAFPIVCNPWMIFLHSYTDGENKNI